MNSRPNIVTYKLDPKFVVDIINSFDVTGYGDILNPKDLINIIDRYIIGRKVLSIFGYIGEVVDATLIPTATILPINRSLSDLVYEYKRILLVTISINESFLDSGHLLQFTRNNMVYSYLETEVNSDGVEDSEITFNLLFTETPTFFTSIISYKDNSDDNKDEETKDNDIIENTKSIMKRTEAVYQKQLKNKLSDQVIENITCLIFEYIKNMPAIIGKKHEYLGDYVHPKYNGRFVTYYVSTIYNGPSDYDIMPTEANCTFEELKGDLRKCIRIAVKHDKLEEFMKDLSKAILDNAVGKTHDSFDFE